MVGQRQGGYNTVVEELRVREYPMLQGSTPCAKSLMDTFAREMTQSLYGNPHSGSLSSQLSTSRIDDVRLRLLGFFNADPSEYDLVFVANATAGVKLVVEAMRALPQGYSYVYHESCHTSLVGAREDAKQSLCVNDSDMEFYLGGNDLSHSFDSASTVLFAYSAQSHMDGRRYPLSWSRDVKENSKGRSKPLYTLLDAASFSATSQLNLSLAEFAADFIVLSLYKIFGFPDLGALIIRRSAACIFDSRRYFGGGTVDLVTCSRNEQWHVRKSQFLHERLEDGTLPFHSILALDSAMTVHSDLFGSMDRVSQHTSYLARNLFHGLQSLQHGNSLPICVLYTQHPDSAAPLGNGPVVSFNLKNSAGGWVSPAEVEKLAGLQNVHIRTGGLCSPGKVATALNLEPWELKKNLSAGFRCGADNEIMGGKPTGVIRASLGAMSTESDVDRFLNFVREFFVEDCSAPLGLPQTRPHSSKSSPSNMRVKSITVYPIKSCGGFTVPPGVRWDVRREGLAWDREWCLIHPGSGQALSQKRYPKMALLRPVFDFDNGVLRVSYDGPVNDSSQPPEVQIPLSANPNMLEQQSKQMPSRVCGEEISAQAYVSMKMNSFFSKTLGVPCVLARFPAGGKGLCSRTARARFQKHQPQHQHQQKQMNTHCTLPGSFPDVPSPPESDSDSGGQSEQRMILLSNESPMLLINSSSVAALNEEIVRRGGVGVPEDSYRANVVVETVGATKEKNKDLAYSEDTWSKIRIGQHEFQLLGSCRRCQMVCVDQMTGTRRQEPFSTLALTRRFDGKVYFGAHMRQEPRLDDLSLSSQAPSLEVGDAVTVEA
ncbi:hypothetical protein E4U43_000086 [Claviceps pusilla]|uniref:Molybdenum cofactor sulfurase n=1 Tax=Claviceps pusilla TaxID=123648 RepID=A0A9P7SXZ0_9HYPO|nr:hypothetical protein E4U43_000086 [Claviceps pusilla]